MLSFLSRRGKVSGAVVFLPLFILFILSLTCIASSATAKKAQLSCSTCQERGYPYMCQATMASGICLTASGELNCNKKTGCTCCRLVDAAGCTFCSMKADWDTYDDDEEDI